MNRCMQVYIVPAAVFVSVVMGGGYGTGREVVEFFTRYGLLGGLLGIGVASCVFALVLACTYEFARVFQVYDYRTFFGKLIGPFWICFEILYLLLFLLVLGVVGSAAGNILEEEFGISSLVGMAGVLVLVIALVYFGREAVEKVLTLWSIGMYLVFVAYFIQVMDHGDVDVLHAVENGAVEVGWLQGGVLYAMYNLAIAPVLLFSTRAIRSRAEAILAGLVTGLAVMIPAILFHVSYAVGYPAVLDEPVPNYWMMSQYTTPLLLGIFLVALLGTLVETGAGLVQGFIERIEAVLKPGEDEALGHPARAGIAIVTLGLGGLLGSLGIVSLVAKGYSALSVGFALVYIIPICTLGLVKIMKSSEMG
ncbi:hypothetical protein DWB85_17170 [Seongchinamella sediminis]|uniref:Membrane protein YkvI n=2 Tax=Halieaceae TaxID=1706372 RepID=A0A2N5X5Z3_9GAMM|nr:MULTISPECIES: hypothetical protein [Halieaceae]PLW69909.1 hypothetical protein C0039_05110 [Pseudohalioglobus lutimaris]RLQ20551.1 hypothetical protein DWB85_17170 [Seongchinamella sediminis]